MPRGFPDLPASAITGEDVYRQRRRIVQALALAPAFAAAGCRGEPPPPTEVPRAASKAATSAFHTSEPLTRYEDATGYNNFYEFGSGKADPSRAAKTLVTSPWSVRITGECARPGTVPLETLLRGLVPEERTYRMRCVEGWSMVIPWLGIPLAQVLKRFEPTSDAKFVSFTSLADPRQMPGVRAPIIDWLQGGLRIDGHAPLHCW